MVDTPRTIEVKVTPAPHAIRVLRVLEYIYPDAKTMVRDRALWQVKEFHKPHRGMTIRSTVMVPEMVDVPTELKEQTDDD